MRTLSVIVRDCRWALMRTRHLVRRSYPQRAPDRWELMRTRFAPGQGAIRGAPASARPPRVIRPPNTLPNVGNPCGAPGLEPLLRDARRGEQPAQRCGSSVRPVWSYAQRLFLPTSSPWCRELMRTSEASV